MTKLCPQAQAPERPQTPEAPNPRRAPLTGAHAQRALDLAARVGAALAPSVLPDLDASLATGWSGVALLHAYLGEALDDHTHRSWAEQALERAGQQAMPDARVHGLGLYAGLCGPAWTETHLALHAGAAPPDQTALEECLLELLGSQHPIPWELTAGLIGYGVYARERDNPTLLHAIGQNLDTVDHTGWTTDAEQLFGAGGGGRPAHYLDLGLAHGLAGAVAYLAITTATRHQPGPLHTAVGVLLAHRAPPGADAVFPAWPAAPRLPTPRWCYGDLGVAAALSMATPLLEHPALAPAITEALTAALTAAPPGGHTVPIGLCHGLAGMALVYRRIAERTGSAAAHTAASHYSAALLTRLEHDLSDPSALSPGWLEGHSGAALAALSAATAPPPDWERALLLA